MNKWMNIWLNEYKLDNITIKGYINEWINTWFNEYKLDNITIKKWMI